MGLQQLSPSKTDGCPVKQKRRSISPDTREYQVGYRAMSTVVRYTAAMSDSQPSLLRLTVVSGPQSGLVVPWDDTDEEFVVGRDSKSHIEVPDLTASRRHCRLLRTEAGIELEDLSANGTVFGGKRIKGRVRIKPGDEFEIGESRLRLDVVPGPVVGRPVTVEVESDEELPALCDTVKLPVDEEAPAP